MANQRATLTFLGAAGTVTGSKYLLNFGDRRILVDCGLFQGEKKWRLRNWDAFPVPPASVSDLVLTHAHMDHSGMIPALVRGGFSGPIWMTEGTRRLVEIVLRDAAKLQEQEALEANERGYTRHEPALPLYTTDDVEAALPLMRVVPFDTPTDLGGGLVAEWARAGHILGSASVRVQRGEASVLFSGDLGRHDHPILLPRDTTPPSAPFVVVESTYGDREHPEPDGLPHEMMAAAIRRTLRRGGSVLIPAFAIDRTELVLKTLAELRESGRIPQCPIWVNSPMALAALDAYRDLPGEIRPDVHLDEFADLSDLREARTTEESKELTDPTRKQPPGIIISSSGMAAGGRVVHHLASMLPSRKNTVIMTGYQAVGTRGRQLVDGVEQLKMFGQYVPVRADIVQDSEFSVHGDSSDLIDWLASLDPKPQTVFVTHGEETPAASFAQRIHRELGLTAVVPRYSEVVILEPASGGLEIVEPGLEVEAEGVRPVKAGAAAAPLPAPAHAAPPSPTRRAHAAAAARPAPGGLRYKVITGTGDEFARAVSRALD